jgi:hypothetical protein
MAPPNELDKNDWRLKQLERKQREDHQKLKDLEIAQQREHKKTQALAVFNSMFIDVFKKATDLRTAATRIGKAYSVAAGRHRDAVSKQQKMKEMETQLMFSILTVMTSGGLSWATELIKIGQVAKAADRLAAIEAIAAKVPEYSTVAQRMVQGMKNTLQKQVSARDLFTSVTKDTLSAGLGEVFSAMGPFYDAPPPEEPASQEPLEFQDDLVTQIDNVESPALIFLKKMADKIKTMPDKAWDKYDDSEFQAAYRDWQNQASQLADKNDLPDDKTMADDLERFIWALWVPRLHHMQGGGRTYDFDTGMSYSNPPEEVYERVRKPIDDRFVALGIETEEETDLPRKEEDTKLIAWGEWYFRNVQPWVSGKAKGAQQGG